MQQDQSLNQSLALSTVKKGIALNVFLAASKFAAGILGHSAALVSDAVDSASDIFSNLIVMAGIKISHKASDMEHQYGHERMECVASIIMSALLALAGAGIGFAGIQKILHFSAEGELAAPDGITLAVAALAIISKEGMYWYTRSVAKKINSGALLADALHHRNDDGGHQAVPGTESKGGDHDGDIGGVVFQKLGGGEDGEVDKEYEHDGEGGQQAELGQTAEFGIGV